MILPPDLPVWLFARHLRGYRCAADIEVRAATEEVARAKAAGVLIRESDYPREGRLELVSMTTTHPERAAMYQLEVE